MSRQLEENRFQLQQLRYNKEARVTAMQKHCDHLNNMDTILTRVTNSVMKTVNLAHKLDLKIFATCPFSPQNNHPRPVEHPLAPSFVSPGRPSENEGMHPPSVDSVPNYSFVPPSSLATNGPRVSLVDSVPDQSSVPPSSPAPHCFSYVRLGGPISMPPCIPRATTWVPWTNLSPTMPTTPTILLVGPLQWTLRTWSTTPAKEDALHLPSRATRNNRHARCAQVSSTSRALHLQSTVGK
jgi:hypothetical protein